MTTELTILPSIVGGALIGLSASLILLYNGRIAGISGIYGGLLRPARGDTAWRLAFVLGLLAAGAAFALVYPSAFSSRAPGAPVLVALAGLLVGFGARLGNGCTSGHGVCGLARRSPRSIAATLTFMAAGFATTFLVRHVLGVGQ